MVLLVLSMALAQDTSPADGCIDTYADANGACVESGATIGANTTIGENAVVRRGAWIGPNVEFGPASTAEIGPRLGSRASLAGEFDPLRTNAVGEATVIGRSAIIGFDADIGAVVTLGHAFQAGARLTALDGASVGYAAQLGDNVTLGADSVVGNLVGLGNWTTLSAGAVVARGVTVADATQATPNTIGGIIGPETEIAAGVTTGSSVRIRKNSTIGAGAQILGTARIGRGATVHAGAIVTSGSIIRAGASVCADQTLDGTLGRDATLPAEGCDPLITTDVLNIDSFQVPASVTDSLGGSLTELTQTGPTADIVGGNRWLQVGAYSVGDGTLVIGDGVATYINPGQGQHKLSYGDDTNPINPTVDLTSGGTATGIDIPIHQATGAATIVMGFYDSTGSNRWVVHNVPSPLTSAEPTETMTWAFTEFLGSVDFTDIEKISIFMNAPNGGTFELGAITAPVVP
jgi:UDP-3-O-[3-hydroxymyristoyl] glucosamine N-acyltransferase